MRSANNSRLGSEASDTSEQAGLAGGTQAVWKNGLTAASGNKMKTNAKYREVSQQGRALQTGGWDCKRALQHGLGM